MFFFFFSSLDGSFVFVRSNATDMADPWLTHAKTGSLNKSANNHQG